MLRIDVTDPAARPRAVVAAVSAARRGDLVLLPTEHVYAIATDAFSARGVDAVRAAKDLPDNAPLAVMVPNPATVAGIAAEVTPAAKALMAGFWPGPLTILLDPQPTLAWSLPPAAALAIRMPLHPVALDVLRGLGPTVVTAANAPGQPMPATVEDAVDQLGDALGVVLDAGPLGAGPLGAGPLGAGGSGESTVVDARGGTDAATGERWSARVVREGALTLEVLRQSWPELAG